MLENDISTKMDEFILHWIIVYRCLHTKCRISLKNREKKLKKMAAPTTSQKWVKINSSKNDMSTLKKISQEVSWNKVKVCQDAC